MARPPAGPSTTYGDIGSGQASLLVAEGRIATALARKTVKVYKEYRRYVVRTF